MEKSSIALYGEYLKNAEKSKRTREKYIRDVLKFYSWIGKREITKEETLEFKKHILNSYKISSVNSIISSLNSFFEFSEIPEMKIKTVKMQRRVYLESKKELTKEEYNRLISKAKAEGNYRLFYIMQTICSCGIRVSELEFITVEAIRSEQVQIKCKGKVREIFLPHELCRALKKYAAERRIKTGPVFVTRGGKPVDRSNIWSDMKRICKSAGVSEEKVFPHNLRHLFARTFYNLKKDIVRLADILGHSSVNTTRIYTMESGEVHRRMIQKLGLLRC